jgi:hypothetical protein
VAWQVATGKPTWLLHVSGKLNPKYLTGGFDEENFTCDGCILQIEIDVIGKFQSG